MRRRLFITALGGAALLGVAPQFASAETPGPDEFLPKIAEELEVLDINPSSQFARARGVINPAPVVDQLEQDFDRLFPQGLAGPIQPYDALDDYYAAAVGAVYLYFTGKSFTLAAEMLGRARTNTVVDSNYSPSYGYRLKSTTTAASLRSPSTPSSGSGSFPKSGSVYNLDAHFAIGKFSYTESASLVTIKDRYDYSDKAGYDSITGAAIQTMYNAQQRGIIKPFRVSIVV